ncbi:MAG: class IV adenylate cyclase [Patescibacteria group bacterium]|jgi:adenylate cyclase class 2
MPKDIEIEIQVEVEKIKPLLVFLEKEAKFISTNKQVDKYFTPKHRNFLKNKPIAEWLRLRDSDGNFSITYKNWHYDKNGKSHYCDEFETNVSDIKSLNKIFSALDFKLLITVDKLRKTFNYKSYEIAIDKVKGLGDFVEIEFKSKTKKSDPAKVTEEMIEFLKKIGVGKINRNYVGYPFMILYPDKVKYEEF